jgi:phosphonate transport system substrate-binding protein
VPKKLIALATLFLLTSHTAMAQTSPPACSHRGQLDELYCDADKDLVADAPKTTISPSKIVLGISSVDDAATARRTYSPLVDHLSGCLKKEVELYPPTREGAVLEGQRNDAIHIGQYSTGVTMYAVNFAGAIPFAGKGRDSAGVTDSYTLKVIVRADSPAKKLSDLKGKKVAHTAPSSNSGNMAPRVLFPELGLKPDVDYKVEFSGGHDKSIIGVKLGLYDAAAIASDVLDRLLVKGDIKPADYKVIYESAFFPTEAFAMSHNLDAKLQAQIRKCFIDFAFPDIMSKQLEGNNRFYPLEYRKEWTLVRQIADASGNPPNKAGYQKILAKK